MSVTFGVSPGARLATAVCIVNWNTRDLLLDCIAHLLQQDPDREIWVLDNGSSDGSASSVRAAYPSVRLVESAANLGFAGGVNELIRRCPADFILLLNSDARPLPGAITVMRDYLATHPWVAAVGPRLVDAEGKWIGCHDRFPTVRQEIANVLGIRRSRAHDEPVVPVDWVEGACVMLSSVAVREVGLLDIGYFMYNEEVDWCYRARRVGWQIACLPAAQVMHAVGRSGSIRRRAQLCSSKIRYQRLHGSRLRAATLAASLTVINAILCVAYAVRLSHRSDRILSHAYAVEICARQLAAVWQ